MEYHSGDSWTDAKGVEHLAQKVAVATFPFSPVDSNPEKDSPAVSLEVWKFGQVPHFRCFQGEPTRKPLI